MSAVIVNIICRMMENLAMTVGIIYAAVRFEKLTVLWFLLLPALNIYRLEFIRQNEVEDDEDVEEEQQ